MFAEFLKNKDISSFNSIDDIVGFLDTGVKARKKERTFGSMVTTIKFPEMTIPEVEPTSFGIPIFYKMQV